MGLEAALVDTYLRSCARCGVAIFVTAGERDVPAWLCDTCAGTQHAVPLEDRRRVTACVICGTDDGLAILCGYHWSKYAGSERPDLLDVLLLEAVGDGLITVEDAALVGEYADWLAEGAGDGDV